MVCSISVSLFEVLFLVFCPLTPLIGIYSRLPVSFSSWLVVFIYFFLDRWYFRPFLD